MEDVQYLRNEVNYNEDLLSLSNGVKASCIFNDSSYFHVTRNISQDIMHDLLEGVCCYDMAKIISHMINQKYVDLEILNNRIKYFNFNNQNTPPQIKQSSLKNGYLIISSSEMLSLVQNFGLIVGDKIPKNDEVWQFYINMVEIVSICLSSTIHIQTITFLRTLISEYNNLYLSLFKKLLKPKHHFLLHYPNLISKVGPLRNIW